MPDPRKLLSALAASLTLGLAVACRDEEPSPVPPTPPPELPQSQAPDKVAPEGARSSSLPSAPAPAAPAQAQSREQLFATYCVTCHGASGSGDGVLAASLDPRPRNFRAGEFKYDTDADGKTGTLQDLANVIQNGAARYGGSPLMAGFPALPQDQVRELASYVRGLSAESAKGG
jgi:mono/diheme cytochrome c family protein